MRPRPPAAGTPSTCWASGSGPAPSPACGSGSPPGAGSASSLGLPVRGVCTLDAVAAGIGEAGAPGERLAVLDGWRGEVFAALYAADGTRIWEPAVYRPEELAVRLGEMGVPPTVAGSGAVRFRHELTQGGVRIADDSDPVHRVAARHVCALAAAEPGEEAAGLAPIYLRPPDAERWLERNASQRAR